MQLSVFPKFILLNHHGVSFFREKRKLEAMNEFHSNRDVEDCFQASNFFHTLCRPDDGRGCETNNSLDYALQCVWHDVHLNEENTAIE